MYNRIDEKKSMHHNYVYLGNHKISFQSIFTGYSAQYLHMNITMPLPIAHECPAFPYVQTEVNRSFVESYLLSWGFDLYCLHRRIIIHKNLCFHRVTACVNYVCVFAAFKQCIYGSVHCTCAVTCELMFFYHADKHTSLMFWLLTVPQHWGSELWKWKFYPTWFNEHVWAHS